MIGALAARFAAGLRFPTLFKLAALLMVVNVLVPDMIPFLDEILMAVVTVLLGSWKTSRSGSVIEGSSRAADSG